MNRELLQQALDALQLHQRYLRDRRHSRTQAVVAGLKAIAKLRAELAKADSYGWQAKHLKTGNIYTVTGEATNCTNAQNLDPMVIYRNANGQTFVRNTAEFQEKFRAMTTGPAST